MREVTDILLKTPGVEHSSATAAFDVAIAVFLVLLDTVLTLSGVSWWPAHPGSLAWTLLGVGLAVVDVAKATRDKNRAALTRAEVNLGYTTIRSPVKGVIVDRRVNIGQTVVSSLTASSLFLIAEEAPRRRRTGA